MKNSITLSLLILCSLASGLTQATQSKSPPVKKPVTCRPLDCLVTPGDPIWATK